MPPQAIINFQHHRTDFYTCISIDFLKIFSPDCLSSWDSNVGKHSFLMIKTHYLTQKFHKWQHLIKKTVAVFLRQQLAVSKSTDLIMKLIVATCENQGWELRIVTDRFFFLLILYFSFSRFFFPKRRRLVTQNGLKSIMKELFCLHEITITH